MTESGRLADDFASKWVHALLITLRDNSAVLGDLDRRSGDGDFGANLATAVQRIEQDIATAAPTTFTGWVTAVSRGFLGTGGTSGPLFGMLFRSVARCSSGEPTLSDVAAGIAEGVATVQRYGRASVGDKTMIDALVPAVDALTGGLKTGADAGEALAAAAAAAVAGARSTADMVARRGRASYVGDVARGVLDPGAAAAALILQAAAVAQQGFDDATVDASWITG